MKNNQGGKGGHSFRWRDYVSHQTGMKIVSIGVAMILWAVVLGSRSVEVTKEVPIEIITAPNVVVGNSISDHIAFRLSGPKAFLRGILDRREEPIRVNLTQSKPALITYRFFSDNIHLPIGVKVLSVNPTAILIKLEAVKRKAVPVRVELQGAIPDGFRVGRIEMKPENVWIKGAESRIESIDEVSSVPVDISHLTKTTEKEISIDLSHYQVHLDSELPKVLIEVEPITANFRIKNIDIQVTATHHFELKEKSVTALVQVTHPEDIQALDRSQVYAVVNLTGKIPGNYHLPVQVILPKNLGLVKVIPSHVDVTLY